MTLPGGALVATLTSRGKWFPSLTWLACSSPRWLPGTGRRHR
jgi:hypothetical protein